MEEGRSLCEQPFSSYKSAMPVCQDLTYQQITHFLFFCPETQVALTPCLLLVVLSQSRAQLEQLCNSGPFYQLNFSEIHNHDLPFSISAIKCNDSIFIWLPFNSWSGKQYYTIRTPNVCFHP